MEIGVPISLPGIGDSVPPRSVIVAPADRVTLTVECDSRDVVIVAGNHVWTCCSCAENITYDVSMNEHMFTKHQVKKPVNTTTTSAETDVSHIITQLKNLQKQSSGDFNQFSLMLRKLRQTANLFKDVYSEKAYSTLDAILSLLDGASGEAASGAKSTVTGASPSKGKGSSSGMKQEVANTGPDMDDFADMDNFGDMDPGSSMDWSSSSQLPSTSSALSFENPVHQPVKDAEGGRKGPGRFLELKELYDFFVTDEDPVLDQIPKGRKEDLIFVVNNTENTKRRQKGHHAIYRDDCRLWAGAHTSTKDYFLIQDGALKSIYKKNDLYCKLLKGQRVVIEPQPDEADVLIMKRIYNTHKLDQDYRRRITTVIQSPPGVELRDVFVAEYIGEPPEIENTYQQPTPANAIVLSTAMSQLDTPSAQDVNQAEELDLPEGGMPGPGKFLEIRELYELFQAEVQTLEQIPRGRKADVYFIISNAENTRRKQRGLTAIYPDDCGAWTGANSSTKDHFLVEGYKLRTLHYKNGQYYTSVRREKILMDPQPDNADILIIRKNYNSLRSDTNYRRRISSVVQCPEHIKAKLKDVYIAEYLGEPPSKQEPHRNSKKSAVPYVRTSAAAKKKMEELVASSCETPHKLYKQMVEEDAMNAPRSVKQVRNARYQQSLKVRKMLGIPPKGRAVAASTRTRKSASRAQPEIRGVVNTASQIPQIIILKSE